MPTTQHRPHGAFAGPPYGTLDGKTEAPAPTATRVTQHRPHGAFAGPLYGTLSGKAGAGGSAPALSAPSASPTGSTTVLVGATTDTASGTLYALARIGGSAASAAAIEAGGQSASVSSTSPSFSYTGLSAATTYSLDFVQKVGADYSNVVTASATTDNPGEGGGGIPSIIGGATLSGVQAGGTLVGNPSAFAAGATLAAVLAGGQLGPQGAFGAGATLGAVVGGGAMVPNAAAFTAGATLGAALGGGALSSNPAAFGAGAVLAALLAGGNLQGMAPVSGGGTGYYRRNARDIMAGRRSGAGDATMLKIGARRRRY